MTEKKIPESWVFEAIRGRHSLCGDAVFFGKVEAELKKRWIPKDVFESFEKYRLQSNKILKDLVKLKNELESALHMQKHGHDTWNKVQAQLDQVNDKWDLTDFSVDKNAARR